MRGCDFSNDIPEEHYRQITNCHVVNVCKFTPSNSVSTLCCRAKAQHFSSRIRVVVVSKRFCLLRFFTFKLWQVFQRFLFSFETILCAAIRLAVRFFTYGNFDTPCFPTLKSCASAVTTGAPISRNGLTYATPAAIFGTFRQILTAFATKQKNTTFRSLLEKAARK